jgi:chemotaxis regulatin CheY-phosphate phosphatase CheZ
LGEGDTAVKITKRVVISVAQLFNKELMALVLDRKGAEESITDEALEATITNRRYGKEIRMLLLERGGAAVKIIKRVVISVAQLFDKELMALILDWVPKKASRTEY